MPIALKSFLERFLCGTVSWPQECFGTKYVLRLFKYKYTGIAFLSAQKWSNIEISNENSTAKEFLSNNQALRVVSSIRIDTWKGNTK